MKTLQPHFPPYRQIGILDGRRVVANRRTGDVRIEITNHCWIELALANYEKFEAEIEANAQRRAELDAADRADAKGKAMASAALLEAAKTMEKALARPQTTGGRFPMETHVAESCGLDEEHSALGEAIRQTEKAMASTALREVKRCANP